MSQLILRDIYQKHELNASRHDESARDTKIGPEGRDHTVSTLVDVSGDFPPTNNPTDLYRVCDRHQAWEPIQSTGELRAAIEAKGADRIRRSDLALVDDTVLVQAVKLIQHPRFEIVGVGVSPVRVVFQNGEMGVIQDPITAVTTDNVGCGQEPTEVALVLEVQLPLHPDLPVIRSTSKRVIAACAPVRRGICHALVLGEHRYECLEGVAA